MEKTDGYSMKGIKSSSIYAKTFGFILEKIVLTVFTVLFSWGFFLLGLYAVGRTGQEAFLWLIWVAGTLLAHWFFVSYLGYLVRARMIAIVSLAVTTGTIPENPGKFSKQMVKKRFLSTNALWACTRLVKSVNRQISRDLSKATDKAAGLAGSNSDGAAAIEGVGSLIALFIHSVLEYADACCLAYVYANPEEKASRAALTGTALYFKNIKFLLKNASKITAVSILSFLALGLVFFFAMVGLIQLFYPAIWPLDWQSLAPYALIIAAILCQKIVRFLFINPSLLISSVKSFFAAAEKTAVEEADLKKMASKSAKFQEAMEK